MYTPAVGDSVDLLDTPSMIVDLSLMERNIATMMEGFRRSGVRVRPHLKTVKSPVLAQKLLNAGASGCCVAKVSEAEVMAAAGIEDLLITTEVVGPVKLRRLINLIAHHPGIKVVVDSVCGADALNLAMQSAGSGTQLQVLVEVNVGQNRTGVEPGDAAVALAKHVVGLERLRLIGIQGYEGHLQHLALEERASRCRAAMNKLCTTALMITKEVSPLDIVTTGGTGTCEICAEFDGVTEVQPGSFVFMDVDYRNAIGTKYANALSIIATVISRPVPKRAIIDAGLKSLSTDSGNAEPKGYLGMTYRPGGDEHGILEWDDRDLSVEIGTRIELIPSHIDTTVNLFDLYYGIREGVIEEIWPVSARGKVQ